MDTGLSKDADGSSHGSEGEENLDHAGDQLYVSLKMENYRLKAELIPHVYGSVPLVGSWDSSKAVIISIHYFFFYKKKSVTISFLASHLIVCVFLIQLSMEPESASMWELSFVVPPNHGNQFNLFVRFCNSFVSLRRNLEKRNGVLRITSFIFNS